jgi:hypothetical protein
VLRKLMVLAATMVVLSPLAIIPGFAQQGFIAVCNVQAQGQEGMIIIVAEPAEGAPPLELIVGPFGTRGEVEAALAALGLERGGPCPGAGPVPPGPVPPGPVPPGPVPPGGAGGGAEGAVPFVDLDVENEAESGDVDLSFEVSNTGDYAFQCTPAVQFGNTGNFNNTPVFQQFNSEADDFEPGGIEFSVEPELDVECSSTIQQSAAASSSDFWPTKRHDWWWW